MPTALKIEKLIVGEERQGKWGPYRLLSIHSGGKAYSTFQKTWNQGWKVGDTVSVEVKQTQFGLQLDKPKEVAPGSNDIFDMMLVELRAIRKALEFGREPGMD